MFLQRPFIAARKKMACRKGPSRTRGHMCTNGNHHAISYPTSQHLTTTLFVESLHPVTLKITEKRRFMPVPCLICISHRRSCKLRLPVLGRDVEGDANSSCKRCRLVLVPGFTTSCPRSSMAVTSSSARVKVLSDTQVASTMGGSIRA